MANYARLFYSKQNRGAVGGSVSKPKAMWLSYAVHHWFITPIFLGLLNYQNPAWSTFLWFHCLSWYLRGPVELLMIYRWFNWKPLYGITHNVFHFCLLLYVLNAYSLWRWPNSAEDQLLLIYGLSLFIGLGFETTFAILFNKTRAKNAHTIYFASTDKKWRKVNQLTTLALAILLSHLVWQSFFALIHRNSV